MKNSTIRLASALSASMAAGYGVLFTIVGDYRDGYGISESQIGAIIGVGFLAAFVAQIFIAPLADKGRARLLVLCGIAINIVGLVGLAYGTDFLALIAARTVSGIGIGTAIPAIRRIVVVSDPDRIGRNVGMLLSADVSGFAIGPAISAVLVSPFGIAAPFIVVATISGALGLALLRVDVAETVVVTHKRLALDLLRSRPVAGAVALGAGSFLMIGAFDALWDVVHTDLNTPDWVANLGITLFALPLIILGPYAGRLAQRIGPYHLSAAGLMVAAVFMASYGYVPNGNWLFAFAMGHALTDGLTISASGVAIAVAVPADRQAGAQGLMGAAQALSGGITAIVIGVLYENFTRAVAYSAAAAGIVVVTVIGMALARPAWRPHRRLLEAQQGDAARSGTI